MLNKSSLLCLALLFVGCKESNVSSESASVGTSDARAEQCGRVEKSGTDHKLVAANGSSRILEAQDGAVMNILDDAVVRKDEVCIRADWSGTGPVMVVSAASVRRPVKQTIVTEECGVLMLSSAGKIVLQVVGNNSERNVNREMEPQDGATNNLLKDYAASMTEVCIKGDFSDLNSAVMVNSQASVRKLK